MKNNTFEIFFFPSQKTFLTLCSASNVMRFLLRVWDKFRWFLKSSYKISFLNIKIKDKKNYAFTMPRSSVTFSYVECTWVFIFNSQVITSNTLDIDQGTSLALIDTGCLSKVTDNYCSFRCKTSNWTDVVWPNNCERL